MGDIVFRRASDSDAEFLAMAIHAAERVPLGEGVSLYECVFGLTREEVGRFLVETLLEQSAGHQLGLGSLFVLEQGRRPVACCAGWIEALDGPPSGMVVATAVSRFVGRQRWKDRRTSIGLLAKCTPSRSTSALQLESFYVDPALRGQGAAGRLIEGVLGTYEVRDRIPEYAEITLLQENEPASRAYGKAGFKVVRRTERNHDAFAAMTGSRGFIQMRRHLAWPASTG
jgi:GNAT superfamily N-acetyltransferase